MTITDRMADLERQLAKYPPGQSGAPLNRRLILRDALTLIWREGYDEGHRDGMRDALDAQRAEESEAPETEGDSHA